MTFRAKIVFASLATAGASLLVVAILVSWSLERQMLQRIERDLVSEARLAAALLAERDPRLGTGSLDDEADRMGGLLSARVTLIADTGRVLGDSSEDGAALAAMENHRSRPEVVAARRNGLGIARRYSTTVGVDLLYVAVPVKSGQVAIVRVALPLTDVSSQAGSVRRIALVAFALALAVAATLAWVGSTLVSRRIRSIAVVAERYAAGDLSRPVRDYGHDEIGQVARVLDQSVQEVGRRLSELARDRAQMQAILSGMVEGVLVVNDAGRVQLVNDAARQMLRIDGNPLDRPYVEIVRHPDIAAQIRGALDQRVAEGVELTLHRDPSRTFVARSAPVVSPGARGAVLVLHDVTDLKRADQIRRDFVANVSHELRTPLTAIRGYVEALADDTPSDDERQRFVEVIARHTARMERLVRDLLRLARLDARQETPELAPCDTEALLAGVLSELAPLIERRRLKVATRVAPNAATLTADGAKLHEVLRNLVENAAHYAREGGNVEIDIAPADGRVELRVVNDGPGIPEADLPRVFERFYRVEKARSRDSGGAGTGLGLAIVKHLVELHGGEVRAANRPAGGATFTVTLPQRAGASDR